MMGFYPVAPGTPNYVIGTPVFEKVVLDLQGKKFEVIAKNVSLSAPYIQSATLNGKPFSRAWLSHEELINGGKLVLQMGDKPHAQWGAAPEDTPPSLTR